MKSEKYVQSNQMAFRSMSSSIVKIVLFVDFTKFTYKRKHSTSHQLLNRSILEEIKRSRDVRFNVFVLFVCYRCLCIITFITHTISEIGAYINGRIARVSINNFARLGTPVFLRPALCLKRYKTGPIITCASCDYIWGWSVASISCKYRNQSEKK